MALSVPTFRVKELLAAGKLNELAQAIATKFSAITGADLTWPLIAEDNIDMDSQYTLVSMPTLWYVINAAEYATLQAAIDAAEAAGGAAVFIPPYTETKFTTQNLTIESSNITIFGAGRRSKISLTSGASNPLLTIGTAITDISIENLTLDGQSQTQKGIVVEDVDRFQMKNVYMKDFNADFVTLTDGAAVTDACTDVVIENLIFDGGGGSANHLTGDSVDGLTVINVKSIGAPADAIYFEPAGATAPIRDIIFDAVRVYDPTGNGFCLLGTTSALDAHSRIQISNSQVYSASDDAFEFGAASKILKNVDIRNCTAHEPGADAFSVNITQGSIIGNHAHDIVGDGLDLDASNTVFVHGNTFPDAGAIGIDASGATSCLVTGNDVTGATTKGIDKTGSTTCRFHNNLGDIGPSAAMSFADTTAYTPAGTGDIGFTHTIPGGTLAVGDTFRITVMMGTSGATTLTCNLEGVSASTIASTGANQVFGTWTITVKALSGAGSTAWTTFYAEDTADIVTTNNGTSTITWTADVDLTFSTSLAGTEVYYIFVEYMGKVN